MSRHEKLNYIEYAARDLAATKAFFSAVFDWQFTDYGEDYCAFDQQGLEGGFYRASLASVYEKGGALCIFYSDDLEGTQAKIEAAGGMIVKAIFEFPGGRRFHFTEPSGNEFAVWSEPV
jgi:predicted enzyme related to lactoylglutathione lyase